jgi:hypothetical protein
VFRFSGASGGFFAEKKAMWRRSLWTGLVASYLASIAAPAIAADLYAQLFPLTGEVRLLNRGTSPIPIVFYQIISAGDALNGSSSVWKSITTTYDSPSGTFPGNGLIDSTGQWQIISATSDELTEAVFSGPGGSLPATRAISLGQIWNPFSAPFPDLVFNVQADSGPIPVSIELALEGDYSANQIIDQADYVIWRRYLDSTTMLIPDGNLDGIVDTADNAIWQQHFGTILPLPPYGIGVGSAAAENLETGVVPEPATISLMLLAAAGFRLNLRRRRRG